MRVGYLGPEGTFSHEALTAHPPPGAAGVEGVPLPTVYDTVMAVHDGAVGRALVPMENSLEGGVNATVDTLVADASDVVIVGEIVHPVRLSLIASERTELREIEAVLSHPQPNAQCARFLRTELPGVPVLGAASTAEAVRGVAESPRRLAALGTRAAAERHGCVVLRDRVEDEEGNETRFVWLAPLADAEEAVAAAAAAGPGGGWKTSAVFWGAGAQAPGWLVRCLSEFAFRGVNLTRIESRPQRRRMGRYMFFVDLEGRQADDAVAGAMAGLRRHAEHVRVLGSYPVA